jgi:hypothetical protein
MQPKALAFCRGPFFWKEIIMWKLVIGFVVFAALALYLLTKGGDIDMGGEKHGLTRPSTFLMTV